MLWNGSEVLPSLFGNAPLALRVSLLAPASLDIRIQLTSTIRKWRRNHGVTRFWIAKSVISVMCFCQQKTSENNKNRVFIDVGPKQWPLRTKELRSQPPWIQCEGCLPLHQIAAGSWGSSFPREGRYWRLRAKVRWCDCPMTSPKDPDLEGLNALEHLELAGKREPMKPLATDGYGWLLCIFLIKCSCRVSSRVPLCHAYALVKTCRVLSTLW